MTGDCSTFRRKSKGKFVRPLQTLRPGCFPLLKTYGIPTLSRGQESAQPQPPTYHKALQNVSSQFLIEAIKSLSNPIPTGLHVSILALVSTLHQWLALEWRCARLHAARVSIGFQNVPGNTVLASRFGHGIHLAQGSIHPSVCFQICYLPSFYFWQQVLQNMGDGRLQFF